MGIVATSDAPARAQRGMTRITAVVANLLAVIVSAFAGLASVAAGTTGDMDRWQTTETYSIQNPGDGPAFVTISVRNVPHGVTIVPDTTQLVIPARGSASFSALVTVDLVTAVGGTKHFALIEIETPDGDGFTLPVAITVPSRVRGEPWTLEFTPPRASTGAGGPEGTWTATRAVEVRNLGVRAETYELRVECCRGIDSPDPVAGITVSVSPTVSVAPKASQAVDVTVTVHGTHLPREGVRGVILVSSPSESPILIALTIRPATDPDVAKEEAGSSGTVPKRFMITLAGAPPMVRYARIHRDPDLSEAERLARIRQLQEQLEREQAGVLRNVEAALGVAFVSDPAGAQDRRLIRGPDGRSSLVVVELTEDEAARVRALAGIAGVYQDEALLWKHVETPGLESGEYPAGQFYQRAREEYRRAREEAEHRAERRRQGTTIER